MRGGTLASQVQTSLTLVLPMPSLWGTPWPSARAFSSAYSSSVMGGLGLPVKVSLAAKGGVDGDEVNALIVEGAEETEVVHDGQGAVGNVQLRHGSVFPRGWEHRTIMRFGA